METMSRLFPWLELIDYPAFCVKNGIIVAVNSAAENRMLRVGTDVWEVVTEHRSAYEEFKSGCLYLTITVGNLPCSASVTRMPECDVFLIQRDADNDQLQALALASQQLRIPLANVMTVADRLFAGLGKADEATQQQANQINRNLFQLLRILGNMSDAGSYRSTFSATMQTVDLTAVIQEIVEKAQTISANTGITITYTGPTAPVLGLANSEKLERAVYNLLSNALKFSPAGSFVEVKLTKNGNLLSLTVCNANSEPIPEQSFWNRFSREPAIEDSRNGLGLGMTLVSAVAALHGGTVLIDHPNPEETRVTMTVAIKKDDSGNVHSPALRISDYAGGRDKALLELSEILPPDSYEKIN